MRWLLHMAGGLWALLRLSARGRFRRSGPYWRWRTETAFGGDERTWPGRWARARAIIDYGRWVHRMRRFTRG